MKKHNDRERDKTEALSPQSMPENSEEIPKPKGYPSSEREALELIDQAYRAYTYYLMFERRKLNLRETAIVVGRVARSFPCRTSLLPRVSKCVQPGVQQQI